MKTGSIHIGKLIEEKVEESGMTVAEFARRINRSSQSIYHIFKQPSIDTELLLLINKALKTNFFNYYLTDSETTTAKKKQRKLFVSFEVETPAEQEKILKALNISLK